MRPLASLILICLAGAAGAQTDPLAGHQGRTIVAVELRGAEQAGLDAGEGLRIIDIRPGDRFSIKAVRRSIKLLYHLGLFGQIRVTARSAGDGLELNFNLEAKRRVLAVQVFGNQAVDEDDLLRLSRLRRGEEYDHWKMEASAADMVELYHRRGYRRARIVSKASEDDRGDVTVGHFIQEGPPTRISRIWFRGRPYFPSARLRRVLGLQRGDVLNVRKLERGIEALRAFFHSEGFLEARIVEPTPDLQLKARFEVVPIEIQPGPKVEFAFEGNQVVRSAELRQALKIKAGLKIDAFAEADLRDRLADLYRRNGFARVVVASRVSLDPEHNLKRVLFRIDEGPRVTVRSIDFVGNQAFPDKQLRAYLADAMLDAIPQSGLGQTVDPGDMDPLGGHHPARGAPRRVHRPQGVFFELVPQRLFLKAPYRKALDAIEDLYLSQGYLDVRIGEPLLSYADNGADLYISIPIEEGPRTLVESISFSGNAAIPADALLAVADRLRRFVKPGSPLDLYGVEMLRKELSRLYASRGYVFCRIQQEVSIAEDRELAEVVYKFEEGPKVDVGRILVRGDLLTERRVFDALVRLEPGQLFSPQKVNASQEDLLALGVFSGVDIKMLDPDVPAPVKDVVVNVRERLPHHFAFAPGISSAEGVRVATEYSYRNLFGYALESVNRAKVNYQVFYPTDLVPARLGERYQEMSFFEGLEWNVMSGLHWPRMWFTGQNLAGRFDIVGLRDHAPSFDLTKVSVTPALDFKFADDLSFTLEYELEYIDLTCPFKETGEEVDLGPCGDSPSRWQRYDEGRLPLGSFRPELSWDRRDNPFNPHSGTLLVFRTELAHSFAPSRPVYYLRLDGQLSGYLPTSRRTTLALSVRAGSILHLTDDSATPSHKLYYLGGRNTVRGFAEENLIPQDQAEACFCSRETADGQCVEQSCVSQGGNVYLNVKAEFRFPLFTDILSGAVFVDVGNLWVKPADMDPFDLRPAAGVGLRLATPIGPLAIDLGFNLTPDEARGEAPFNVHFNVGVF